MTLNILDIRMLKTGDLVKAITHGTPFNDVSIDDLANELNERFAAFDHAYFEDVRQMTNSELKDRGT